MMSVPRYLNEWHRLGVSPITRRTQKIRTTEAQGMGLSEPGFGEM
jgi:hypothetical protein